MIPLELRKRRIERAVLTQFGDHLDDAALRELATGPLIQRLHLSASRTDGLDECTREMFSLAMLVRLGKVSEQDIRETFAAFRRLDVNDEGVLNSKSIIAAMIQKRCLNSLGTALRTPSTCPGTALRVPSASTSLHSSNPARAISGTGRASQRLDQ
jgi:alkylhydroperoxidase/carboxymuconolactone decarboxylase family protein YurZ